MTALDLIDVELLRLHKSALPLTALRTTETIKCSWTEYYAPNKGSEVVDQYHAFPGLKTIMGPAGLQLGTGRMSVPKKLGSVDFDLGVIAGSRSLNLMLSTLLPQQDDGKVSVESTKVEGMQDHIVMPVTHPFMMKNNKVIKQVIYFLNNGEFERKYHFNQ